MRVARVAVAVLLLAGCARPPAVAIAPAATRPVGLTGLPNVVAYGLGIYSGGVPDGDAGFATLRAMGVRTVISVDGATPDVGGAGRAGLRYVHLPIGYDGVPPGRGLEIARAVRDLSGGGPVYIHCHHGKHRSAAAAGVAAVSLGRLTPQQAGARMAVSGTSREYPGLFAAVAAARPAGAELDTAPADFPAVSPAATFVEAMVQIDVAVDHLKAIQRAGWVTPTAHPDLVPAAEAGRVADLLRKAGESPRARADADFAMLLGRAAERASTLEAGIVAGEPPAGLSARMSAMSASCTDCHVRHRN